MSTIESDSDISYQPDDSEFNFIPGYAILEDAECENSDHGAVDEAVSETSNDNRRFSGLAYADEPLADEEWLQNYQEAENKRLEEELNFLKRFDGSLEISEWLVLKI
jgi:hypothetical protein